MRDCHVQDLDFVCGVRALGRDAPALGLHEIVLVVNTNFRFFRHYIALNHGQVAADGPLVVFGGHRNLEVVEVFTGVNLESRLVSLEGDTVSDPGTEHHLRALHEVVHAILHGGHESLLVN